MGEEDRLKHAERILGIPIFTYEGWDEGDVGSLQFYDVQFLLPELAEKYNDKEIVVIRDSEWMLTVSVYGEEIDDDGVEAHCPVFSCEHNLLEFDSFLQKLKEQVQIIRGQQG